MGISFISLFICPLDPLTHKIKLKKILYVVFRVHGINGTVGLSMVNIVLNKIENEKEVQFFEDVCVSVCVLLKDKLASQFLDIFPPQTSEVLR